MRRLIMLIAAMSAFAVIAATQLVGSAAAATVTCTQTGLMRDQINLTAAQIGGNVTGTLDASGANTVDGIPCNIGVYFDAANPGTVSAGADISGANYYGVVVNHTAVNLTNSAVHNIGEVPFNGTQHGNAVLYINGATGTVHGNTVSHYQKNGISVSGKAANGVDPGTLTTTVSVTNNTVTGEGPVNYIAQNGIQMGYGAKGAVTGNIVTGNAYTGAKQASSGGILVVGGPAFGPGLAYTTGLTISKNTLTGNDVGVFLFNADALFNAPTLKTNNSVKLNTIKNVSVTNTTGDSATCGYQAGVSNLGHRDAIVNNKISGFGYTPTVGGDCTGTTPAFLRFIDTDSSARAVPSNK